MHSWLASRRFLWTASAILVLGTYALIAAHSISLPAIYMDGINPDYLAVRMANPASHTAMWVPPGKYFVHRFLLVVSPYAGALHGYLELPFYYLFGGTVTSFRISHIFLGMLVLFALYLSVAQITRSILLATLSAILLALDPTFVFAFRTQGYVQLFPTCFTLLGILLCCKAGQRLNRLVLAGVFFGLSAWGYFIFGFFVPGLILAVYLQESSRRWQRTFALIAGIFVGSLPLLLGYIDAFLIYRHWAPMLDWFRGTVTALQRDYHPAGTTSHFLIFISTLTAIATRSWALFTGSWIWQVIFGFRHTDPGQILKAVFLLLIPAAAMVYDRFVRRADCDVHNALTISLFAISSYLAACIGFGGLIMSYHYYPVLILCYFAASVGVIALLPSYRHLAAVALLLAIVLCVADATALQSVFSTLRNLGGRRFYSHVVTDYAMEEASSSDKASHVFVDWGGMLQFIYLTEGRIPTYDSRFLTAWGQIPLPRALCGLGPVKLVFIGDGADSRGPAYVTSQQLPIQSVRTIRDERDDFQYVIVQTKPSLEACKPVVANPSFEEGTLGPWKQFGKISAIVDHSAAHTGQFGLDERGAPGSVWQDIGGLEPGRLYEVSAWLAASSDGDTVAKIGIFNQDTGKTIFSRDWRPGQTWRNVRFPLRLDQGNSVKLHLWKQAGKGAVYWDDVRVTDVALDPASLTRASEPTISNPGFEDGTFLEWTPYGKITASVNRTAAHTGQFGVEEQGEDGSIWQDVTGLEVGKTYEISAWLAASADGDTTARIAVFNSATGETTFSPEWKPTPKWTQVKYSVRLDKGDTLKIHLWKQSGKAAVYWDDVQFEAVP